MTQARPAPLPPPNRRWRHRLDSSTACICTHARPGHTRPLWLPVSSPVAASLAALCAPRRVDRHAGPPLPCTPCPSKMNTCHLLRPAAGWVSTARKRSLAAWFIRSARHPGQQCAAMALLFIFSRAGNSRVCPPCLYITSPVRPMSPVSAISLGQGTGPAPRDAMR